MEGEERLRTSSISLHNVKSEQHSLARLSSNFSNLSLAKYYDGVGVCNNNDNNGFGKSMLANLGGGEGNEHNVFYLSESRPHCERQLDVDQLRGHYGTTKLMCPMSSAAAASSSYYPPRTLFVPAMRVENEKLGGQKKKCCFNLCSCSKRCPSNSSIWSLSEPDLTQSFRVIQDNNQNVERLQVNSNDEQYAHLTRVITPPNAFLNQTYEPSRPGVSYSNKVTQTEAGYIGSKKRHNLQRHFSLGEGPLGRRNTQQPEGPSRHSVDTEHIYHTIAEREQWQTQQAFREQSKRSNHDQTQSRMRANYQYDQAVEPEPHRIATCTKNGLPCPCNQCREARGNC